MITVSRKIQISKDLNIHSENIGVRMPELRRNRRLEAVIESL